MGTSAERSSCNTEYYTRGDVLPGIWMDGMDVLAVRNGFEFAIKHAVETGPVVVEVNTYRLVFIAKLFNCIWSIKIQFQFIYLLASTQLLWPQYERPGNKLSLS